MDKVTIDLDELTFGELEEIQTIAGADAAAQLLDGVVSPAALVAVMYITGRKADPKLTLEDVRATKVTKVEIEVVGAGDVDPTAGAPESGSSAPAGDSSGE